MKKYDIEIEEILRRVISQEADSIESALDIVEEKYDNEEIVLDSSDFVEKSFNNLYSKPLKEELHISIDFNPECNLLKIISNNKEDKYFCDCVRDLNRCLQTFVADYLEDYEITADDLEIDVEEELEK